MINIGINIIVHSGSSYSNDKDVNLDFRFDMFNKAVMIDYTKPFPALKPEHYRYTVQVLNNFFGIVTLTKMEIF